MLTEATILAQHLVGRDFPRLRFVTAAGLLALCFCYPENRNNHV
jgi:hypothetical protein